LRIKLEINQGHK